MMKRQYMHEIMMTFEVCRETIKWLESSNTTLCRVESQIERGYHGGSSISELFELEVQERKEGKGRDEVRFS